MAVKIRLSRIGAKKKPFYRIVVADGRTPDQSDLAEMDALWDKAKAAEKAAG